MDWSKGIQNSTIIFPVKPSYSNSSEIILNLSDPVDIEVKNSSGEIVFVGASTDLSQQKLVKGLYLINDMYPLVIKGESSEPITVVFPYINNLLYTKKEGKLIIDLPSDTISMNFHSAVSEIDLNMFSILDDLNQPYNVVTESDIQDSELWQDSKCLILYGKTKFYSEAMNHEIRNFVLKGGNVLLISSAHAEYELGFNILKSIIVKRRDAEGSMIKPIIKIPVYESYGGTSNSLQLYVKDNKGEKIAYDIVSTLWSGYQNFQEESSFEVYGEMSLKGKVEVKSIMGRIKFNNSKNSGSIFFIGSEEVLLDINLQNKKWKEVLLNFLKKAIKVQ